MSGTGLGCLSRSRLVRRIAGAALAIGLCSAGVQSASALTFVIDFKEVAQGTTADMFGAEATNFNVTSYGFAAGDYALVTSSIIAALEQDFRGIVTSGFNVLSPIPDGQELDIDFVIGDIGGGASNGDTDFYYVQVGSSVSDSFLGQACLGCVRGNPFGAVGAVVASIFTDNINALGGVGAALTSGDLLATTNAITGTLSHEIGHTLDLEHCYKAGSVTDNGNAPLLGTGALDMPNADRLLDREFSFSCNLNFSGTQTQNSVQTLVTNLGLRDAPDSVTELPEPAMGAVFGLGLLGMAAMRRRARRAA
ncbi:MAG: hypothetical protein GEU92_00535 [Alphaproteobacteria bacterium]|nr:hypothetical protein [Alphaproteobacteria bacterium]